MAAIDRIEANLARLREWAETGLPLPFVDERLDYVVGNPLDEDEISKIETEFQITLPAEYREFVRRFGDTNVGPGIRRCREAVTAASKLPFPLKAPFVGCMSPSFAGAADEFDGLVAVWNAIPKGDGVLSIGDYGCGIRSVLVLNGPYVGQIWINTADSAYYGPFGPWEPLHDESLDWIPTDHPREFSFVEWYENWLTIKLKMAGFLAW